MEQETQETQAEIGQQGQEVQEATGEESEAAAETATATISAWSGADTAEKLSFAAELYGVPESELVEELLWQKGGDEVRWQMFHEQRQRQGQEQMAARLAAEFDELQAQVPEIREVRDVPPPVLEAAMNEGVSLLDAFLRRWYGIQRHTAAQMAAQQRAAAQSAGRLGEAFEMPDPKETAFSRSFRTALS